MPSASGDALAGRPIPPDLEADYRAFRRLVLPWLESREVGGAAATEILETLTAYGLLVYEQTARLSLIARGDRPVLFTRHVLDSINLATCTDVPPASLLDVGSGAGFPGIPLAIVWPQTRVTLLESRDRKAGFLEHVIRRLGLARTRVVCDRLERVSEKRAIDPVGAATIRAVGDLASVVSLLDAIAAPGAWWAYFLGGGTAEADAAAKLGSRASGTRVLAGAFGGRILRGALGTSDGRP
jgi:16S rRNA (guanine(527)-N(7))-methyltransferase RsmG